MTAKALLQAQADRSPIDFGKTCSILTTVLQARSLMFCQQKVRAMQKFNRSLTGKHNRQLRSLGHNLQPTLMVGKEGVTEAVIDQFNQELLAHELVKVKVLETSPDAPVDAASLLAQETRAHIAQVVGRTALLFRPHPEKPRIRLSA